MHKDVYRPETPGDTIDAQKDGGADDGRDADDDDNEDTQSENEEDDA